MYFDLFAPVINIITDASEMFMPTEFGFIHYKYA